MILLQRQRVYVGRSNGPNGWRLNGLFKNGWLTELLPANSAVASTSATTTAYVTSRITAWAHINYDQYTAEPHAVDGRKHKRYQIYGNAGSNLEANTELQQALSDVPIPDNVRPSLDSGGLWPDSTLLIYDFSTDTYYELFVGVPPETNTGTLAGKWSADWGGRIDHASTFAPGHWLTRTDSTWGPGGSNMRYYWGASGTSIPMCHTGITVADLIRINPYTGRPGWKIGPLGLLCHAAYDPSGPVWPAQRNDPSSSARYPQGTRHRIPNSYFQDLLDEDAAKHRFVSMLDWCMWAYGSVHQDSVTFDPPSTATAQTSAVIARGEPGIENYYNGLNGGQIMAAMKLSAWQQIAIGSDSVHTPTV